VFADKHLIHSTVAEIVIKYYVTDTRGQYKYGMTNLTDVS